MNELVQHSIFAINNEDEFNALALKVFRYQAMHNPVYKSYLGYLNVDIDAIDRIQRIPFLPIQFFKSHKVLSSDKPIEQTFLSSGTTGMSQSKHHVTDASLYEKSYLNAFSKFYGGVEELVVLALLPSYLEREGSSLIYMVDDLIQKSHQPESGFYLDNLDELQRVLLQLEAQKKKTLLIGVSFALLDLIEKYQFSLKDTIVMETGGMKGKRKEMIREELHAVLKRGFGVQEIHSEYGMTELLSQAYSIGKGVFNCPPWMKILIRDTEDPLSLLPSPKTGGINVIDLANLNSCSFIATQDLGKVHSNNSFEILGRFDNSDIRGCNLLIS
ncbi:LuxE/PaaK family acyltransferase [Flavicella marina]|uniref:LuxE/PaaK family acyltransferase n=1 Tax=Flavicella marina TaxID=1475951 RepID=UPI001265A6B9|nr:acyl transferase [Flavicella marina]